LSLLSSVEYEKEFHRRVIHDQTIHLCRYDSRRLDWVVDRGSYRNLDCLPAQLGRKHTRRISRLAYSSEFDGLRFTSLQLQYASSSVEEVRGFPGTLSRREAPPERKNCLPSGEKCLSSLVRWKVSIATDSIEVADARRV
jgi:hypothetical protein